MQTNHAKIIRGLSIATVVLSAIAIAGCVIGLFALGAGGVAANEYGLDAVHYSQNHVDGSFATHWDDGYHHGSYALSDDDLMGLLNFGLIVGAVAVVWELLCAAVSLVAGIMGIRGANVKARLGGVFGWSIAGAVAAFLSGRIVTCVLLVIAAVYASKDKNAPEVVYAGMPGAAGAPGAWGAANVPGAAGIPGTPSSWETASAPGAPGVADASAAPSAWSVPNNAGAWSTPNAYGTPSTPTAPNVTSVPTTPTAPSAADASAAPGAASAPNEQAASGAPDAPTKPSL